MKTSNQPTLIRVLSTGRAGTKFLASVFADQGYLAYHEGLYAGEPSSALIEYTNMLGDVWGQDPDRFYAMESNFPQPYIDTVSQLLGLRKAETGSRNWLTSMRTALTPGVKRQAGKVDVLVDCTHLLTTATPMIERALEKTGVAVKDLVLFRNPLKMIHAIYKVEAPDYWARSSSFSQGEGVLKAANVWGYSYRMIHDLMQRGKKDQFEYLQLERFSTEPGYTQTIFDFLGIPFDAQAFEQFTQKNITRSVRSSKYDTARNSDLFHDPEFSFDEQQIKAILKVIGGVLELYNLDGQQVANEYRRFHQEEKQQYAFR
ncbi:MAG: hypothetical protein DWQ07_09335 [Chloroflexi bacterium]|nr:MAG: hypothetical protein DWQ07_09335 [Chloroflexota bacterium]MBL1193084.1 hypothetical protein [Chloroflexota bacterium]NOH10377.1 hypothetical protein [Chloroflexota bacterium]